MSKKANWVKFQADMYDNKKLKYIDSLEDNNLIYYIWTGTILLAGKCNRDGELYLSNSIPYTVKTLAIEFRRTVDEVAKAYDVLCELEMIELTEDKVFCLPGWSEYQSIDGLDKIRKQTNERVARYREKKREERRAAEEINKAEDNDSVENHIKQSEDYTDGEIAQADGQNNEDGMVDVNSNDSNAADGDKANDDAGSILEDNINEDENCIEEQATKSTSEKTKSEKSEFGKTESKKSEFEKSKSGKTESKKSEFGKAEFYKNDSVLVQSIADNNIADNNNVTGNDENYAACNKKISSVTQENKKEIKKQNKKRREKEIKGKVEGHGKDISLSKSENIYSNAIELAAYCEKLTGRIGLLDINGLNMAIEMHGSQNVKNAIEKSIECGKINTRYILGILKNWRAEGYPIEGTSDGTRGNRKNYGGGKSYGAKCDNKGSGKDTEEFKGFKPKESPRLSESERKKASANVI